MWVPARGGGGLDQDQAKMRRWLGGPPSLACFQRLAEGSLMGSARVRGGVPLCQAMFQAFLENHFLRSSLLASGVGHMRPQGRKVQLKDKVAF